MFYNSEKCISSVNTNISQILDNLNSTSCVKLCRKPEVIPLYVNRACVNDSDVSINQELSEKISPEFVH